MWAYILCKRKTYYQNIFCNLPHLLWVYSWQYFHRIHSVFTPPLAKSPGSSSGSRSLKGKWEHIEKNPLQIYSEISRICTPQYFLCIYSPQQSPPAASAVQPVRGVSARWKRSLKNIFWNQLYLYSAVFPPYLLPPSKVPRQLQRQPVRGVRSARDGHLLPAAPPLALPQSIAL